MRAASSGQELIRNNLKWAKQVSEMNGSGEDDVDKAVSPEAARFSPSAKDFACVTSFRLLPLRSGPSLMSLQLKAHSRGFQKPGQVRKIAEQEGLHVGKVRITRPARGFKKTIGARVISTSQELALRDPNEITHAGFDAKDLCLVDLAKLALELRFL